MTQQMISLETNQFKGLFRNLRRTEIIEWKGSEAVGLSFLKNYPNKGLFVPTKNANREHDSVALIKVGYYPSEIKNNKVLLIVRIHKSSRYLLNNHWDFNFEDEKSPTKESIDKSKMSRQPIDLEETSRYEFHINENKIFDLDKSKFVKPAFIVEEIYKDHLKTLTNLAFRSKMAIQQKSILLIPRINKILEKINFWLFGRTFRDTKDYSTGIFKTYSSLRVINGC